MEVKHTARCKIIRRITHLNWPVKPMRRIIPRNIMFPRKPRIRPCEILTLSPVSHTPYRSLPPLIPHHLLKIRQQPIPPPPLISQLLPPIIILPPTPMKKHSVNRRPTPNHLSHRHKLNLAIQTRLRDAEDVGPKIRHWVPQPRDENAVRVVVEGSPFNDQNRN